MSCTLRPFRDYDEKDVINFFSVSGYTGLTQVITRGTLVKIVQGWQSTDEPVAFLGSVANTYNNTQSLRYGAYAQVAACGAGDSPLGILLKDVRELDENGEQLKFNPVKAAEMDVVVSGQAVPIVTRGIFLYSGTILTGQTPTGHTKLYAAAGGELTTGVTTGLYQSGVFIVPTGGGLGYNISGVTSPSVGFCLGAKDSNGCVLIRLNVTNNDI